jgi:TonB family protein
MLKGEVVNDRKLGQCKLGQFRSGQCRLVLTLGLFLACLLFRALLLPLPLAAQSTDQSSSDRKVITRVEPEYPDALKRLYIGGVVRLEVEVAPSGVVKSTKLLGGSPILGQSSMKAVKQWRYAPAATEEVLTVKLEFDPHR